jgi:hypothetical protein
MNESEVRAYFTELGFPDAWEEFAHWIFHQTVSFNRRTGTKTYYKHDVERFVMRLQARRANG